MKQSLSYYITMLVIKLKGLKNEFSKSPIDYKKIRKSDIHHPKSNWISKYNNRSFNIADTLVTEIKQKKSNGLLIFIHGGAFISGPAQHHWDGIKEILKHTNQTVWMCDYPKAPESRIAEISSNIDQVYQEALEQYPSIQIILIGDSVGATLIMALVQRVLQTSKDLPKKMILVSPVMDATLCNPKIEVLEKIDPMLSKAGVLSAKTMCAEIGELTDPKISPLFGSFVGFPETVFFLATNDITYPDQLLTIQKLREAKVNLEIVEGQGMPHIWPLLPVMKEAKMALNQIIDIINK